MNVGVRRALDGMAKPSTEIGIQEEGARSSGITYTVIGVV